MAEKSGAFLGLLKSGGKKPKPKSEPMDEAAEGEDYSKVGEPLDDDEGEHRHDEEEEDSAHKAAFDSFAESMSIPHEKRARTHAALKAFVKACSKGDSDDDH